MARIRTIKPDFWTDEKIVELSYLARLLFIGLLNFCDDDGRMQFSPKKIKMQIFPADHTDLSGEFEELRGMSLINIYIFENIEYLEVCNFSKHQKIDKRTPSKLPPSPNSPDCSPNPPDGREGKRKGREGKGRDTDSNKGNYLGDSNFTFNPDDEVVL